MFVAQAWINFLKMTDSDSGHDHDRIALDERVHAKPTSDDRDRVVDAVIVGAGISGE